MARTNGNQAHTLTRVEELRETPYRFGFFEAVRALECEHADKPRIGHSQRPADDPVRFGQEASPAFAPASLSTFQQGENGDPARLQVRFFGLFGPNGPLPLHLTEYARDRLRNDRDPTFSRFADVFHHRMLCLFYRAWSSGHPAAQADRPDSDRFAVYLGSLLGIGIPSHRGRDAMPDAAKLFYAGRLSMQSRNAEGLRAVLADFFGLPFDVEEFVGAWLELPRDSRCRLGESPATGTLGQSATIGAAVWDAAHKFRIRCGPLGLSDYERMLPDGDRHGVLCALVLNYTGEELAWDLRLTLDRYDIPPLHLGSERLGWTTWLGGGERAGLDGDVLLHPEPRAVHTRPNEEAHT